MDIMSIKKQVLQNKKNLYIWLAFVVISFLFLLFQPKNKEETPVDRPNIDTYIPEGFVLAPVELSNAPYLDGLLEYRGVVDLYTGDPARRVAQKVASAIKIIRSPRNPSYFAVLVPEDKVGLLIQRFQTFHAVIQNPKHGKKTRIQAVRKKRNIIVEAQPTEALLSTD